MRGIAAVSIFLLHAQYMLNVFVIKHSYLGVDFFFLLSGFVLSYAYGARLDRGMPSATFLQARFARLYPLYALSFVLSLVPVVMFIRDYHLHTFAQLHNTAWETLTGLLLLPSFVGAVWAFPMNIPAWSLFDEAFANLFQTFLLRRRSNLFLLGSLVVWGALFAHGILQRGSADFGPRNADLLRAVPRVLFSYTMGILLFRFWSARRGRVKVPAIVPCVLFVLVMFVPPAWHLTAFDLLIVGVGFPCLLLLGAYAAADGVLHKPAHFLGLLSYPLYILQGPVLTLLTAVQIRLHPVLTLPVWWAIVAGTFVLTVLAAQFYDIPVRAALRNRLHA